MMTGNFLHHCKRLIIILLLLVFSSGLSFSQKMLHDLLEKQPSRHVVSIASGSVTVEGNVLGFNVGDTVLLIQMQGVKVYTSPFGGYVDKFGEPGLYEFLTVSGVDPALKKITFLNSIIKSYDEKGNVQVVRVPYYNSAEVNGVLTCNAWDEDPLFPKTGGVLALTIGRTITLTADIDVTGKGFKGGSVFSGASGICQVTDLSYQGDVYPEGDFNSGYKGEGVANYVQSGVPISPGYVKGQGANFNGGGGGNGKFSGGGGGAHRGEGGIGGNEDSDPCPSLPIHPYPGGAGGVKAEQPSSLLDRIFLGGGGGASTTSTGTINPGGNGGGIIIIVTDNIIGKGGNIISSGNDGGLPIGVAGAGGGGAGGSIVLSLNSYGQDPLSLSVTGGNGGNSNGTGGEGGGGGGGLIWLSTNTTPNVETVLNPGLRGYSLATAGEIKTGFKAVLNGFLYNSIRSSGSGDTIDFVCSNMLQPRLTGTLPLGGNPPYTYKWEKSYDNLSWEPPLYIGNDSVNYFPNTVETSTVYYKRTVISSAPSPLTDYSKVVKIVVQPFIKNNIVGNSDIICFAQNPPAFTSKATLLDGNGVYSYVWKVSHDNLHFSLPSNAYDAEGYTPPPSLTMTSWYRRTVISGSCIDSTAIVKITVLDTIKSNKILNSPPVICYGTAFANLTATTTASAPALSGGDNTYRFKWESNINGLGWALAPGVSNGPGYDPVELPQRIPSNQYVYRRIVYSGTADVCASISNSVLLKDFPVITNNTIAPVPAICSGSKPVDIVGSVSSNLSGGNLIYTYSWEDSTKLHSWTLITGASLSDFPTSILYDTTSYRRIVTAVCTDFSKSIQVVVHKPILNNKITLLTGGVTQTICNNQAPVSFQGTQPAGGTNIPGDYAYMWKYSTDNSVFTSVPTGGTGINYSPPSLASTTYYKREVTSGKCAVISDPLTVTVLPDITNNSISGTPKVCYSLIPGNITGGILSGGSGAYKYLWEQSTDGGINWSPAALTNSSSDYQPPALTITTKYRRTVSSGVNDCCESVSNNFDIDIDPLPVSAINAGPDTIIYSVEKLYHMKAIDPALAGNGETGTWALLNGGTSTIDDTTKFNTVVRNLSEGKNSFLWTLHRGPCKLKDSVDIELLKDFIPQGFSPNGDAWNNTFVIEGLSPDDQHIDIRIVNGAGTEVYSFSGEGETLREWKGWDGKNSAGNDLPEGTYYYMLKITGKSGQVLKRSGFVVLKRY